MADMKDCPLKFAVSGSFYYKEKYKCSEDDCAWWMPDYGMCAIKNIAYNVDYIERRVGSLQNNVCR